MRHSRSWLRQRVWRSSTRFSPSSIGYVVKDAKKWEVDPKRIASEFDANYYRGLLEKAWSEAAFLFS
jgi:hypothetical protein